MVQQGVQRYIGLSLGGGKSDRTCVTVIDHYRKQDKSFVVDIFESIGPEDDQTADQVLLDLIEELSSGNDREFLKVIAVDAPLTLPPSLLDCKDGCSGYEDCKNPSVKWMRLQYERTKSKNRKIKHFTPYTQRPVDLYFRYKHPDQDLFQDETFGANLAPQAARMQYLKRNFESTATLIEVWPKLALYYMHRTLKLPKKDILLYRQIEQGVHIREHILEKITEHTGLFVYERDQKKIIKNIPAFDSLLCACVALLYDLGKVVKFRSDLPLDSGWVQVPDL